ncbi:hypothetical protein DFH27DRAFT_652161 [Peziza echinospora]|nr:hypothetical protein DFH27DRAFT_652161 [Peziza echinospora]
MPVWYTARMEDFHRLVTYMHRYGIYIDLETTQQGRDMLIRVSKRYEDKLIACLAIIVGLHTALATLHGPPPTTTMRAPNRIIRHPTPSILAMAAHAAVGGIVGAAEVITSRSSTTSGLGGS